MAKAHKLVVANWKMNPGTLTEARKLFSGVARRVNKVRNVHVVICPPVLYAADIAAGYRGTKIRLGAQNVSVHEREGAFTGEVSARMLSRSGIHYAIIGHSERRVRGETDTLVAAKVRAALRGGLSPIVCVGEREHDRDGKYFLWLERQIIGSLVHVARKDAKRLVVAYEPLWAIGRRAKDAITPRELHEMTIFIKKILSKKYGRGRGMKIPILYGGSVEPSNARALLHDGGIDGFLVGHASLSVVNFVSVVKESAA